MTLSEWLKTEKLSDGKFAELIETTPQSVLNYRRGLRIPHPKIMERIIAATNGEVTANDFYMEPVK